MKNYKISFLFFLASLFVPLFIQAQMQVIPLPIESIELNPKNKNFYAKQIAAWQTKVKEDPNNSSYWLNYYMASRYAYYTDAFKYIPEEKQIQLNKIEHEMRVNVESSAEHNFVSYLNASIHNKNEKNILSAYQLKPNNALFWGALLNSYELNNNTAMVKELTHAFKSKNYFSELTIEYHRNLLLSIPKNGVIFCNGIMDFYTVRYLQLNEGISRKVRVLNLPLMLHTSYQINKCNSLGLKPILTKKGYVNYKNIGLDLIAINPNASFYYPLTTPQSFLKEKASLLQLNGLSYAFTTTAITEATLVNKWENFDTKALNKISLMSSNIDKNFASNYLLPALLVYNFYIENKQTDQANKIKILIDKIALATNKTNLVNQWLSQQ